MDKVHNIEQASEWFIYHRSGSVTCIRDDGNQMECSSFIQAVNFFRYE